MLIVYKKLGIPVRKHYFEHSPKVSLLDLLLPSSFMDCYNHKRPNLFSEVSRFTLINDLQVPEEEIFQNFQSRTRSYIRQSQRDNFFDFDSDVSLGEFTPLCQRFSEKKGLSYFELEGMQRIPDNNYAIFAMRKNGKIVFAHLYLCSEKTGIASLLISASDPELSADTEIRKHTGRANRELHWQAMREFKARGFTQYDWGGYALYTKDESLKGINKFKRLFNGELRPIYNYYSPMYRLLKNLRSGIVKKSSSCH